jgi:GMP synthase-like glutamine amidotransferase
MSVNDADRLPHLTTEMKLIEEALRRNIPVLGICLGAQLIARTLGAAVYRNKAKEIGWYDVSPTDPAQNDPLLGGFASTEKIFQWHGETFDIPRSTHHLAFSSLCANQAFRYGDNVSVSVPPRSRQAMISAGCGWRRMGGKSPLSAGDYAERIHGCASASCSS